MTIKLILTWCTSFNMRRRGNFSLSLSILSTHPHTHTYTHTYAHTHLYAHMYGRGQKRYCFVSFIRNVNDSEMAMHMHRSLLSSHMRHLAYTSIVVCPTDGYCVLEILFWLWSSTLFVCACVLFSCAMCSEWLTWEIYWVHYWVK